MPPPITTLRRSQDDKQEERFSLKKVLASFTGLPRVLKVVWTASPPFTLGIALLTLVRGFMPLANTLIAGLLVDAVFTGIVHKTISPIWFPVLLQLGVSLLDRLLTSLNSLIQSLLQDKVTNSIQLQILHKSNLLDLSFFENPEFYDKMRTASQESVSRPLQMISQTFDLGRTLISLFSMLGLLLHLAWWLVLISLLLPLPSFLVGSRYSLKNYYKQLWQSPEKRQQQYLNRLMTTDDYNKEIKLFNIGAFFINRYVELNEKFYAEDKQLQIRRSISNFLLSILSIAANSAIYLYVALQAVTGSITIGALTRYSQAVNQTGANVQSLLDGVSSMYENNLYVDTLFEFLTYQPKITSPESPTPLDLPLDSKGLAIEFRNVSFTYPEKTSPALKNISFTIRAGETVALVGRNGAGKTTLVKLLTRLYDPDEGEILVAGINIKEYDLPHLREQVGVIFQDFVKYSMTVRENIGVGQIQQLEQLALIEGAAQKSGADKVVKRLKKGYEAMLGRWFDDGTQLSGGEWQKVALARAFMRDARILILDEPTSALDAQAEYDVFTRFRHLTEGKTAVFISHRFSTVRLADHIIVIEHGVMIEKGTHLNLMALNGRYAELFNLQAEAYR